jgi:hypothetical protein
MLYMHVFAEETMHFFACTAQRYASVMFPVHVSGLDAMYGAVEIQAHSALMKTVREGGGHLDKGSHLTSCLLNKNAAG